MIRIVRQWWDNRPSACRARREHWANVRATHGLTEDNVRDLAEYNRRRSQGVLHAPDTVERMADFQARYDAAEWEVAATANPL